MSDLDVILAEGIITKVKDVKLQNSAKISHAKKVTKKKKLRRNNNVIKYLDLEAFDVNSTRDSTEQDEICLAVEVEDLHRKMDSITEILLDIKEDLSKVLDK